MKKASDEDFKDNYENVVSIIREYNVKHFARVPSNAYASTGSVGFYVRMKGQPDVDVMLEVNDSLYYKLPKDHLLMVPLPLGQPSKVCLTMASRKICDVISASPFTVPYFELKVDPKEFSLELKPKTEKEAQNYIRFLHETGKLNQK